VALVLRYCQVGPAFPLCREPDGKLSAQIVAGADLWASSSLCAES
jgi:hypothetical protein